MASGNLNLGSYPNDAAATAAIPPSWVLPIGATYHNTTDGGERWWNGTSWRKTDNELVMKRNGFALTAAGFYGCTLSYDAGTQTLTITPVAPATTWSCWTDGTERVFTGAKTITHGATTNGYFLYCDSTGALVSGTDFWNLRDSAPIVYAYYNAATGVGIPYDERHTIYRDPGWHLALHQSIGTFVTTGFALSGYTLQNSASDTALTWAMTTGNIMDEDLTHVLDSIADGGPYTLGWRTGVGGAWEFTLGAAFPYKTGGTYLQWNRNLGGTWSLVEGANGNYINYFIYLTPSLTTAYKTIVAPGQQVHASLAAAQAETPVSMDMGGVLSQEIVAVWQLTMRLSVSYATTGRCRIEAVARTFATRSQSAMAVSGSAPLARQSGVIYVDKGTNLTQDGSLNYPYHTIAAALTAAGDGDVIDVGPGTYAENGLTWAETGELTIRGSTRLGTLAVLGDVASYAPTVIGTSGTVLVLTIGDGQMVYLQDIGILGIVTMSGTLPRLTINGCWVEGRVGLTSTSTSSSLRVMNSTITGGGVGATAAIFIGNVNPALFVYNSRIRGYTVAGNYGVACYWDVANANTWFVQSLLLNGDSSVAPFGKNGGITFNVRVMQCRGTIDAASTGITNIIGTPYNLWDTDILA